MLFLYTYWCHMQREELERLWDAIEPATRERLERFGMLTFPALRNHEVVCFCVYVRVHVSM